MSSEVATQTHTTEFSRGTGKKGNKSRGDNSGPRGSNRHRRPYGGNKGKNAQLESAAVPSGEADDGGSQVAEVVGQMNTVAVSESGDSDVCWICAEPVKYWAVPECNHRVCHVCAIRLRALYKKMDCTFCKEPQAMMVFTASPDALFASFTPESIPFKDTKLSVYFETQEMMEDTLILLRFNCPDQECDYIGNGWGDLRLHVRAVHGKLMCDLCLRNKKVFAHEHAIYPPSLLPVHLPSMAQRASKAALKEPIEGGVHPLCAFCRECFFGDDELYSHMREKHEECFICKRNEIRDQYFQNYDTLERHFTSAHHACTNTDCLARKFVVFNTALDLKAHTVEEHGGDMTSRDRKDARRVQADFAFEEVGRRRDRERDRDRDRDRDREPPPHQQRPPPPTHAPTPAPAPARPPGGVSRRREGFGGALTDGAGAQGSTSNANGGQGSRPVSPPTGPAADIDPAVAEKHAAFLARLQSLAPNPSTAVPVVKAATRGYRSSESNARDLISTIWNVMDQNLEQTASIINAFVDLLDEEEKRLDLLSSWKGFVIEQRRQFPDLAPASVGAGYAGITSGRVLNAKHATTTRSSQSQQVWNRVAQAASSSLSSSFPPPKPQEKFPALAASSGPSSTTPFRQGQRSTPWSGSSAAPPTLRTQQPVSIPASGPTSSTSLAARSRQAPPPKLSNALFPELPSAVSARSKPQVSGNVSLKKILGSTGAPTVSAWAASGQASGGGSGNGSGQEAGQGTEGAGGEAGGSGGGGKGKKGKGKQKQTLFTLGTFPA